MPKFEDDEEQLNQVNWIQDAQHMVYQALAKLQEDICRNEQVGNKDVFEWTAKLIEIYEGLEIVSARRMKELEESSAPRRTSF